MPADLRGVAGEFLTQRQRRRVLRVGAADLDDVGEFQGLGVERIVQVLQRGQQPVAISRAAATCMAVGKVSLEDWPRLTWSLGCTGALPPRDCASISLARAASTSLTFMLVWVPEPVCQGTSGK